MVLVGLIWVLWASRAWGFSFRSPSAVKHDNVRPALNLNISPSEILQSRSRLPNLYAVALNELQELESEPLCHRIAARLLVNNCQLLEGKDEATILTDSGRQVRDFVDSYAASLAICDLERGSFEIPSSCSRFHETALAQLPLQDQPRLHVTSVEIDQCLSGLAQSNSAWTTWVSYRHKALRFCEAARADQEKAQSILLYQRLTKVIAKLADGVEVELSKQLEKHKEMEDRMNHLDRRAQETGHTIEQLFPQLARLKESLTNIETHLSQDVGHALRRSTDALKGGHENAAALQQVLGVLLSTVLDTNARVAVAHEQSLERVNQKATHELDILVTTVASAVAASVSLQNQMELSQGQVTQLAIRQSFLEEGMQNLLSIAADLSTKYNDHAYSLAEASNMTSELLDTLEEASSSAATLGGGTSKWWPYIFCPIATLLLGSYGLAPSALRNLWLLGLGELLGFAVSSFGDIRACIYPFLSVTTFMNNTSTF